MKPNTSNLKASSPYRDLLRSLIAAAWALEAKDPYTGGHLWRVSILSGMLARAAGFAELDISRISIGAFLHDMGKLSTPDHILQKRGKLTNEERITMDHHPCAGGDILKHHPLFQLVKNVVLCHHERVDGTGYPKGLRGNEIPVEARIVSICDAFDAMTSDRSYRKAMKISLGLKIIKDNLGNQFDRELGQIFLKLDHDTIHQQISNFDYGKIPLHDCRYCGPIISMPKNFCMESCIYCPNCACEYRVTSAEGIIELQETGNKGQKDGIKPWIEIDYLLTLIEKSSMIEKGHIN